MTVSAKEKRVSRFLANVIEGEGIKADVRFYDERGLRLAAFTIEGPFGSCITLSRGLLKELTENESIAIGLHEIAHVKYEHSGKKVLGFFRSLALFIVLLIAISIAVGVFGLTAPRILSNIGGFFFGTCSAPYSFAHFLVRI